VSDQRWTELRILGPDAQGKLAFECPSCEAVKTVREDSFAPGLHQLICRQCGFSSGDLTRLGAEVVEHDDAG
jgi:predicted RNA-binding Zn-ribbon protein involved in translation (DUF1610 family)